MTDKYNGDITYVGELMFFYPKARIKQVFFINFVIFILLGNEIKYTQGNSSSIYTRER